MGRRLMRVCRLARHLGDVDRLAGYGGANRVIDQPIKVLRELADRGLYGP